MVLRPDGTVTAIGGNGQLATYDSSTGTWTAGPLISPVLGEDDGPAVLLPDGNVFFQVSQSLPDNCYGTGSLFFEWDASNLTEEPGPPDSPSDNPSYEGRMLVLPTGQVLYADAYDAENESQGKNLYVYTPTGTYQAAWQPTVTSVAATLYQNSTDNYIYGSQFNGLSQGSMYGDDEQAAENFPLVYIKNLSSGHVIYCRTHSFSTMAVATGSATTSAEFDVPGNVETGPSDLVVVVNGIPSAPVPVNIDYGQGQQNVVVSPTRLSFVSYGSPVYSAATLTNNGPGALAINSVTVAGETFSLNSTSCSSSLPQNESCSAHVEFAPGGICLGTQYGTLNFNDAVGQQTVNLTGTQKGCIEVPEQRGGATPQPSLPLPANRLRGGAGGAR